MILRQSQKQSESGDGAIGATITTAAPALYRQVADELGLRVRSGEFDSRLPTLRELADEYRVGMVTMRRAVKVLQDGGVVTAAPGRGIQPTRLRRGRTETLGIVLGDARMPLGSRLVQGVQEVCRGHRQALACECYFEDLDLERKAIEVLTEERQVDGLVLWLSSTRPDLTAWAIAYLRRELVPFVLVPEPDTNRFADCHTVSNAESGAAADVMTHLLALGHRRIRFVTQAELTGNEYEQHRYERYERSMRVAGLSPLPRLLVDAGDMAAELRRCDAVFCANDRVACRLLRVCLDAGIRVPADLAAAGYDNTDAAAAIGLTTVEQHFERIGHEAAEILLADIGGGLEGPQHRVVNSELIIRTTTDRAVN